MADILEAIKELQGRFTSRTASLVSKLRKKDGLLVPSSENLVKVAEIIGDLKGGMIDDKFAKAVADYLGTFDGAATDVFEQLKGLGKVDKRVVNSIARQFKGIASDALTTAEAFTTSIFTPLANDLTIAVMTGAPLADTIAAATDKSKELGDIVKATAEGTQVVMKRTVTSYIADEVGAEFFRFQGRPIDTTREWCRERAGKIFHRKEIEDWGRKAAGGQEWAGMVEGTNEKTIFVHLGGWYGKRGSCRHVLTPLDILDVPKSDLERMRKAGYID